VTNYNDGKWHGWNGGECPVHVDSIVEGVYLKDGELTEHSPLTDIAAKFDWCMENAFTLIAFRVVKEHCEPREFWIAITDDGDKRIVYPPLRGTYAEVIHVREVG